MLYVKYNVSRDFLKWKWKPVAMFLFFFSRFAPRLWHTTVFPARSARSLNWKNILTCALQAGFLVLLSNSSRLTSSRSQETDCSFCSGQLLLQEIRLCEQVERTETEPLRNSPCKHSELSEMWKELNVTDDVVLGSSASICVFCCQLFTSVKVLQQQFASGSGWTSARQHEWQTLWHQLDWLRGKTWTFVLTTWEIHGLFMKLEPYWK